jgi:cytochrome oxidase Cu insertion factor (SCO1/SenC/PrrC family)
MSSSMSRALRLPRLAFTVGLLALASAVALANHQQPGSPPQTVDVEMVGPKVGEALPEFSLRDQDGHVQSLKSLLGPKGAIIVFFRSADW